MLRFKYAVRQRINYQSRAQKGFFAFHELPDAFERLMSPDDGAKVIQKADISKIGSRAIIEMKILGIVPVKWIAEHTKIRAAANV